jgi:flavin-dependent dehydrogenase
VAADGAGSKIGQSIRGPFPASEIVVATECVVPNERGPYVAIVLNPTRDPSDLGYSWSFARSDGAAVGTGVRRDHDRYLAPYRAAAADAANRLFGHKCANFRNWIVPLYSPRPAAKGNVALVGDALGTADPLFAEGIASGLYSAQILAESFETHGDFSRYGEDLRRHPYFRDMKFMELLQRRGNADFEFTYAVFSRPRELGRLLGLVAGTLTAREYVLWLTARHPILSGRLWLDARVRASS